MGEVRRARCRYVRFMPKAAATGIDVAAVEAHLARYVVSCPLCKAVDQLGVGQHLGRIESANGAKDSIAAVVVVCKRCGYLMPLAADLVTGNGNGKAA
jgi:phage terminase large subunit GpA-like protein